VTARRFSRLSTTTVCGRRVPVAATRASRLLGLAFLDRDAAGPGLLIPRCRSVHTFGMRFALDVLFVDEAARPLGTRRGLKPRRVAFEWGAQAVLEVPAEEAA
jgi:uncharacterized membrane protein (UPF0127 family)